MNGRATAEEVVESEPYEIRIRLKPDPEDAELYGTNDVVPRDGVQTSAQEASRSAQAGGRRMLSDGMFHGDGSVCMT